MLLFFKYTQISFIQEEFVKKISICYLYITITSNGV